MAGLLGLLTSIALCLFYFHTAFEVILRSLLAGFLASLPVSLIVVASLFQLTIMDVSGALNSIISFSKQLCAKDSLLQILILVIGFGTILSSAGAVPVTVITPILFAMGYSPVKSISLAALGYDSLCTYTVLGIPLVVFSDMIGIDLILAARHFSAFCCCRFFQYLARSSVHVWWMGFFEEGVLPFGRCWSYRFSGGISGYNIESTDHHGFDCRISDGCLFHAVVQVEKWQNGLFC